MMCFFTCDFVRLGMQWLTCYHGLSWLYSTKAPGSSVSSLLSSYVALRPPASSPSFCLIFSAL